MTTEEVLRFTQIENRLTLLEKARKPKLCEQEDKIIDILKKNPTQSFSIRDFVKAGVLNPQYALDSLLLKLDISRQWFKNHYEYYCKKEESGK